MYVRKHEGSDTVTKLVFRRSTDTDEVNKLGRYIVGDRNQLGLSHRKHYLK